MEYIARFGKVLHTERFFLSPLSSQFQHQSSRSLRNLPGKKFCVRKRNWLRLYRTAYGTKLSTVYTRYTVIDNPKRSWYSECVDFCIVLLVLNMAKWLKNWRKKTFPLTALQFLPPQEPETYKKTFLRSADVGTVWNDTVPTHKPC
jgi:hypothetical protein